MLVSYLRVRVHVGVRVRVRMWHNACASNRPRMEKSHSDRPRTADMW